MFQTTAKHLKITAVFLFLLVLSTSILACGSSKDDPNDWFTGNEPEYTDTEPEYTDTEPEYTDVGTLASVDSSVEKSSSAIGAEGGEVILSGGAVLTVQPGMLKKTATIGLEQFQNPGDFGQGATSFEITGLGGITGSTELSFPVQTGLIKEEIDVYGYEPNSKQYFALPYVYDSDGNTVTVTIKPSAITSAINPGQISHSVGVQPGVVMAMAHDGAISTTPQAGVFERLQVLFTPQEAYVPQDNERLIQLPFYEQTGGSCWAVDTEMIISGFIPAIERKHQGHPLFSAKAGDDDFGLTGGWIYFQEVLPRYISSQIGAGVSWRGFINTEHLRWRLLQELDAGHPVILELPGVGTGHYLLVIGYQNSGESFIIHDSKGVSPVGALDGGMYTVRPWTWIAAHKGGMTVVSHIMWPDAEPAPDNLLSLACPGGSENGGAPLGQAFFYYLNPKNKHPVPVATLQYHPSSLEGVRWQNMMSTVKTIPNNATSFGLTTKLWNADFQPAEAEVKIQVRKDADVFFTKSLGKFRLPAANYNTTTPVTVTADIPVGDFRDPARADGNGILHVYIDVMLMQGNTIMDSFTLEADMDVTPVIDKTSPASVGPGDLLTITGSCFGKEETANSEVVIDDETMEVVSWSDTEIVVQIPDDFEGTGSTSLVVMTGKQYIYESNSMPLTVLAAKVYQVKRDWSLSNTDVDGVLNASFNWVLAGTGDYVIESETEDEIKLEVLAGVPLRLTVNSQGSMTNSKVTIQNSSSFKTVRTYHTPRLYDITEDGILEIGGDFSPVFSCSGGNINVDFTFSDLSQFLTLTVAYCVDYDETMYDEEGTVWDTKTDELEWYVVRIIIEIEAYEPDNDWE